MRCVMDTLTHVLPMCKDVLMIVIRYLPVITPWLPYPPSTLTDIIRALDVCLLQKHTHTRVEKKIFRDFAVGDIIDACDTVNKWYESTVVDMTPENCLVHYNLWADRWNEWVFVYFKKMHGKALSTKSANYCYFSIIILQL